MFFSIRKSLIGRRAYSESIYTKQKHADKARPTTANNEAVTTPSVPSPKTENLLEKAFTICAC